VEDSLCAQIGQPGAIDLTSAVLGDNFPASELEGLAASISARGTVRRRKRSRSASPTAKKKALEMKGEELKKLKALIQERVLSLNEQVQTFREDDQAYIDNLCENFMNVWKYATVKQILDDSQFDKNLSYYFDNIKRISQAKYEPSVSDIALYCRPTNGIFRFEGKIDGQAYQFTDVGGRFSERKKWDRLIAENNFDLRVHFVSLDEYDIVDDYEKENRMELALKVWGETTQYCPRIPYILIFNNRESFVRKLKSIPFPAFQPDFTQSLAQNADYCIQCVIDMFKARFKGNFVLPLVTEAISAEEVEKIVNYAINHC